MATAMRTRDSQPKWRKLTYCSIKLKILSVTLRHYMLALFQGISRIHRQQAQLWNGSCGGREYWEWASLTHKTAMSVLHGGGCSTCNNQTIAECSSSSSRLSFSTDLYEELQVMQITYFFAVGIIWAEGKMRHCKTVWRYHWCSSTIINNAEPEWLVL